MNISAVGKKCVGCRACEQACPVRCISMQPDSEGFLYPAVDEKRCVDCGLCVKSCAQAQEAQQIRQPIAAYAVRGKDEKRLMRSASGGMSDLAVQKTLELGGVAFGAAYCEGLEVRHVAVSTREDSACLQSSKYVQSDLNDTYDQARDCLSQGKKILYTGTPCQIAGLYQFLGGDDENLTTMDLICHGVPSPLLFRKYIEYMGERLGEKVQAYDFRYKGKRGWGTQYILRLKTQTRTRMKTLVLDKYGKHFMAGDCLRECCYRCRYAGANRRPGDLTIGDFWGVEGILPDFSSPKGVSCVLVNSEKGEALFDGLKESMDYIPVETGAATRKQGNLIRPTRRPDSRDHFYDEIRSEKFISRLKVGLEPAERIKALMPVGMVRFLKKWRAAGGRK